MKVSDFDFDLPEELIAQRPIRPRDRTRLMVVHRESGEIEHRIFRDVVEYLRPGDLLVLNTTRVIPARLLGRKVTGASVEVFLLEKLEEGLWRCLVRPGSKVKVGTKVVFDGRLVGTCVARNEDGTRNIVFDPKDDETIFSLGRVPIPPYVRSEDIPPEDYQTVYAKYDGSVAAPTAGLHFTEELLDLLREKGIGISEIVLHVGLGTFRPVRVENVEDHRMESEFYHVPSETVSAIEETKGRGGRVVAVGTTVVRTLETIARLPKMDAYTGRTDLFIYPPFEFKLVDALITNFHLPRSTLIMLVSAFAGLDLVKRAYNIAVRERYRFFSFGDAMLIL